MHIRYTPTRKCKLNCKNCYLKDPSFQESLNPKKEISIDIKEPLQLYQYLNVSTDPNEDIINGAYNLFESLSPSVKNFKQVESYMLITDISTFMKLQQNTFNSLQNFLNLLNKHKTVTPVFSLSFKTNSDYDLISKLPKEYNFILSFVYGIDNVSNFKKLSNSILEGNNLYLSFMLEKPITIDPTILIAMIYLQKKFLDKIQIDPCINKAINGYDCTKTQNNEYEKVISLVEDEGFYDCTYPSSKCIITIDTSKNIIGSNIIQQLKL